MTLESIFQALDNGLTVHWRNHGYVVLRDDTCKTGLGLLFTPNDHYSGLTLKESEGCYIADTVIK